MGRLEGRVAVVTGAASGIGLASVRRFLDEGAEVVAVDIEPAAPRETEDRVVDVRADVTDPAQVQRVVDTATERFGRIDVYFSNAGRLGPRRPVEELSLREWSGVIDANLTAFFLAARAVVPVMRTAGGGVLLVTSSAAAQRPRPGLAAYVASKGGAIALARQLALELAGDGIRVNAICPVATDTPMLKLMGTPEARKEIAATIPLGRLGTAADVAAAAAYLASDDASFITGVALDVDGGRSL